MQRLSNRLSRELIECGNLPISEEGLVRLRPDLAHDLENARSLLDDEITDDQPEAAEQLDGSTEDILLAEFSTEKDGATQSHLFLLDSSDADNTSKRIKRWSKTPVSYGSFVQVRKFLTEAWGEVRNLEIRRVLLHLGHEH